MKRVPTISEYIKLLTPSVKSIGSGLIAFNKIADFNEFWQSIPILAHFVPTGKDGMPLEKPKDESILFSEPDNTAEFIKDLEDLYNKQFREFQEAEKNVRWVGFKKAGEAMILINNDYVSFHSKGFSINGEATVKTYGQLITSNIPLEPKPEFGETLKI